MIIFTLDITYEEPEKLDIKKEGCFKMIVTKSTILSLMMSLIGRVSVMSAIRTDLILGVK